jgi:hypothetical protein
VILLVLRSDIVHLEGIVDTVKNTQERVKQEYEDNIRAERSARRKYTKYITFQKYDCLKTYLATANDFSRILLHAVLPPHPNCF